MTTLRLVLLKLSNPSRGKDAPLSTEYFLMRNSAEVLYFILKGSVLVFLSPWAGSVCLVMGLVSIGFAGLFAVL